MEQVNEMEAQARRSCRCCMEAPLRRHSKRLPLLLQVEDVAEAALLPFKMSGNALPVEIIIQVGVTTALAGCLARVLPN